jgi:hypothetical protein
MRPCKSLRFVSGSHRHFRQFNGLGYQSVHAALLHPAQSPAEVHGQCFAIWQSERCGAGCGHGSLRIVAGSRIYGCDGIHSFGHTLRFYIRPHCVKYPPVSRAAPLVSATASRPAGLRSRHYAKWPTLVRACQPSALPSRFAPSVHPTAALVLCWRSGISQLLCKCFWSAASPCILCLPPPTPGLACFAASPARSARPPPAGAPSVPRADTPPLGGDYQLLVALTSAGIRCWACVLQFSRASSSRASPP